VSKRIKSIVHGDLIALYALRGYLASQYPYHDIYCDIHGPHDDARLQIDYEPDVNLGIFDAGKLDSAIEWLASRNEACKTLMARSIAPSKQPPIAVR
jgi:hypothetical protein